MVFAAGSTLHKGAYRIESLLHSDPYSLTLQAIQTESDRPVVLQTLNPALTNRAEIQSSALLAQVRDAFLTTTAEVFGKDSDATPNLVECFVEQELPVVVVETHSGQAVPPVIDWLPALELWVALAELSLMPASSIAPAAEAEAAENVVMDQHLASVFVLPPDATTETLADAPPEGAVGELATLANGSASHPTVAAGSGKSGASVRSPSLPAIAPVSIPASARETGNAARTTVLVAETPPRWRRVWLPSALALTALATGLVGAVVGMGLRGGEDAPLGQLLTKEQAFPSINGWPGSITAAPISNARRRRLAGHSRSEEGFIPLEDEPIYFDSQQRRQSTRIPEPETTLWQDNGVLEPSYQQESAPIAPDYGLDAPPEPRRISPLLPNEAPAPDIAAEEPVLADPAAMPDPIYAAPREERSPQLESAPQKPVPDIFQTPPSGESPFVPYEAPAESP